MNSFLGNFHEPKTYSIVFAFALYGAYSVLVSPYIESGTGSGIICGQTTEVNSSNERMQNLLAYFTI